MAQINLKKIALTAGLAVVLAFFVYALIDAFYAEPTYDQFCNDARYSYPQPIPMKAPPTECPVLAPQEQACYSQRGMVRYTYDNTTGCPASVTCDMCQKQFEEVHKVYTMRVFYITAPIGLLAIILGLYLPLTVDAIASGFMFGGIFTLIQSTVRAFQDFSKIGRVIVLGIELAIIVWIGYRKMKDTEERKERPTRKKQG